jgi:hypothetical protein
MHRVEGSKVLSPLIPSDRWIGANLLLSIKNKTMLNDVRHRTITKLIQLILLTGQSKLPGSEYTGTLLTLKLSPTFSYAPSKQSSTFLAALPK